jgi:RimJ/RimL family protein N-acetyltransferase
VPSREDTLRGRVAQLPLPVRGPRLDLVPVARERVPELTRLLNDPSVARWTLHIPHPYSEANAVWWVRRATRDRRNGTALSLSIVRRSDGALVGGVGLHQLHEEAECAEIGYWLGRAFRGQGYATEAVTSLVHTGFRRLKLHRIEALVFPRNLASQGVVRRCGFRYEGRIRDEAKKDGRWLTTLLFARIVTDTPVRPRSKTAGRRPNQPVRRR